MERAHTLSAQADSGMQKDVPADAGASRGIIGQRWPILARAIGRCEESTAERFSAMAYEMVERGIIRHDNRASLAKAAEEMGIRSFDAQLLIACAIRQWAMDRRYESTPTLQAPMLSFEYRTWRRAWLRFGIMITFALTLDAIILWRWLS